MKSKMTQQYLLLSSNFIIFIFIVWIVLLVLNSLMATKIANVKMIQVENKDVDFVEKMFVFQQDVKAISEHQDGYVFYSNSIHSFLNSIPNDIKINNIIFDSTNNKIRLSGLAKNRAKLNEFKKKMKAFDEFSDFRFSNISLLKESDVGFMMNADVKFKSL